ncbi:hypothetical protein BHE74_00019057 [Ensete ventricosum]|nr:hypothetical protein BHE74_00019057 [Ensete ventricosum]
MELRLVGIVGQVKATGTRSQRVHGFLEDAPFDMDDLTCFALGLLEDGARTLIDLQLEAPEELVRERKRHFELRQESIERCDPKTDPPFQDEAGNTPSKILEEARLGAP